MHTTTWPRVLLLFAVLLAFVGSLSLLRTRLLHPRTLPTATPIVYCPVTPTDLIIVYPSPSPRDGTALSLDLPGPILIDPTPCRARSGQRSPGRGWSRQSRVGSTLGGMAARAAPPGYAGAGRHPRP